MNTCFAPISIKFTDQVQTALESLNVSQVSHFYWYSAEGGCIHPLGIFNGVEYNPVNYGPPDTPPS